MKNQWIWGHAFIGQTWIPIEKCCCSTGFRVEKYISTMVIVSGKMHATSCNSLPSVCVTDACIRKHILRALTSTMEPTTATTVLACGLVLVFSDSMMKLDGGNTKGRWSRRGSKVSPCKGWLCVKACCVQKLLCVNCFLCKGICG